MPPRWLERGTGKRRPWLRSELASEAFLDEEERAEETAEEVGSDSADVQNQSDERSVEP